MHYSNPKGIDMNDIPQPTLARDPHENEFIPAVGDVTTTSDRYWTKPPNTATTIL